jgi:RimJ/RimL family protein N-acetyltransferase
MLGPYFLETDRLGFRSWRAEDLPLALALWGNPDVTRFIARSPLTAAEVDARLQAEIAGDRRHGIQYWPIFRRADGAHVGCCGLRPHPSGERVLELGVHLRPSHRRQGLAEEAATAAMAHAFQGLDALALFAGHHPENVASRKLLLKLGFRSTGEDYYPPTGLMHPSYLLAATEWYSTHPWARSRGARST